MTGFVGKVKPASFPTAGQVCSTSPTAPAPARPARPLIEAAGLLARSGLAPARTEPVSHGRPVTATGALSGTFDWACDKGRVNGRVLLAPTTPATIQSPNFRLIPNRP